MGRRLVWEHSFWEVRNGQTTWVWEESCKQLPLLKWGMDFQWILEESITHGITKVKDIWRNQVEDQEFWFWAEREWWERLVPREEVDRMEEAFNNKCIRMNLGKMRFDADMAKNVPSQWRNLMTFWQGPTSNQQVENRKNYWRKNCGPKVSYSAS